jgi:hypothetical protein
VSSGAVKDGAWDIRFWWMSPSVAAVAATFLLHVTSYGGDVQPAALGLSPGGRLTGKGAAALPSLFWVRVAVPGMGMLVLPRLVGGQMPAVEGHGSVLISGF